MDSGFSPHSCCRCECNSRRAHNWDWQSVGNDIVTQQRHGGNWKTRRRHLYWQRRCIIATWLVRHC